MRSLKEMRPTILMHIGISAGTMSEREFDLVATFFYMLL